MTERQLRQRAASIEWMLERADQFSHAVTLTLKPYRIVATDKGDVCQVLTDIEAKNTFRQFVKRLNISIFGNAAKRYGKSLNVIPMLEGKATKKSPHYHCALGGFPADLCEAAIAAKIASAWHLTAFGNEQVKVKPMQTSGWLTYSSKEIGLTETDVIDWENVRLAAASLT